MSGPLGEASRPANRRDGGELIGVTAMLVGGAAIIVTIIDSQARGTAPIPGTVSQVLTGCACLAGLGAVIAWLAGIRRSTPPGIVGAVLGLVAGLGTPAGVHVVQPPTHRARLVAIDLVSGTKRWERRLPLYTLDQPSLALSGGQIVVAGENATGTCGGPPTDVRVDAQTGRVLGHTRAPVGPQAQTIRAADGPLTFELRNNSPQATLTATSASGATLWSRPGVAAPANALAAGDGVVAELDGFSPFSPGAGGVPDLPPLPGRVMDHPDAPTGKPELTMHAVDETTEHDLWSADLTERSTAAIAGQLVWVLGSSGALDGRDVRSGRLVVHRRLGLPHAMPLGPFGPTLLGVGDHLVAVGLPATAIGLDSSGTERWRSPLPPIRRTGSEGLVRDGAAIIAMSGSVAGSQCNVGD